jgi:F420-non-reducing hydrogenase small subunit
MTATMENRPRQPGKLRIGVNWASACGGCDISVLEIAEHLLDFIEVADVVFWPCVTDFKYATVAGYPDAYIDVCLCSGAIRSSEQEEIARLLRLKSRTLVAYGACAMDGGIPALANLKSSTDI